MDKLKEVKKIIQMMNEGSVTTQDLQTFITATLEFVKKQKDDFLQISQDSIDEIDKIVLYIEKEHEKTLQKVDEKSSKLEQELTKQIKEVKYLLEGAKNLIPQDGRDGLNGKDGKDGSPDTPEEIVKKINTTENSIDAKVIKDSATYVRKNDLDYAVSVLENQTRFLIASNSNRGSNTGGVSSVNGITDAVTLSAGTNMSLNQVGNDIEFNANFTQSGKYMISGGATWSGTGLTYDVSFLTYFFNGNKTADPTSVTLASSDPTNNRLDAIVVDEAGVVSVITGDASSSPVEPPIPADQLQVQFILVEAGSTAPTIASENIYLDDPTSNWTFSTYSTATPTTGSINFAGTNTPFQGINDIEASTDLRLGARFVRDTSFDAFQYTMLQVWVRFTGTAVASNKSLNVRFENSAGTLVANTINLFNYGLQRGILDTWQLVVVPITAFGALPATVKGLKMIMAGGTVGQVRQWDVDYMILTNGSVPFANVPTIAFYKDNVGIASQSGLNIVEGLGGATITGVNSPTNNRVDYTFNAFGGDELSFRDPASKVSLIGTDIELVEPTITSTGALFTGVFAETFIGSGAAVAENTDDTNLAFSIATIGDDGKPNGGILGGSRGTGAFIGVVAAGQHDDVYDKPYVEYTAQIAGQGGGLDYRNVFRSDAAGTRIKSDNLFVLDASRGEIRLRQTSSSTDWWEIPVVAGAEGYVLTAHGDGAEATWEAPTASASLTSTYVGYGDGSNLLTGSADLTWDNTNKVFSAGVTGVGSTYLTLDSINNTSKVSTTGTFQVTDDTGAPWFEINNNNHISYIGKITDNRSYISVDSSDDLTREIVINTVSQVKIGDVLGVVNSTQIIVDDSTELITITNVPTYADDAAAVTGGLTTGQLYKTTTSGITALNIVP